MVSSTLPALFLSLAVSGVFGTPLQDLFETAHEKPLKMYQCYRNATSFEDPSATDLTVRWSGRGLPDNELTARVSYSLPGSQGKTTFQVGAEYVPQNDNAILTGEGITVELYELLPPYNEKAYYFKQVVTSSGLVSLKIYDTSSTCDNAEALRDQVCPEPCSLEPTQ